MAAGQITAVLGPTNTGKTHYALERMLAHRSGVIGLPLRLLAREIYDRLVRLRGPSLVALVTGEERIVPDRVRYWVATVEAMPAVDPDFLAVDEIQLCADPERGHVFTDRLLHARGRVETLFLGAETMRPAIAALVPGVQFQHRERLSTLTWTGPKKLSRLPRRSAIVGFSVGEVYEIAELLRRQKGGAAVVMGALSPRTRNAQVALYQNGDVDYLVATDAIGMGLNLDISHVAFSSTVKFDGRRLRALWPNELAQIAGRAGRHLSPGTFGVTAGAAPLDPEVVAQIEQSRFAPLDRLNWRNADLDFGTLGRLIASLEQQPPSPRLRRARDADDVLALRALAGQPEIARRAVRPAQVDLLWQVCRIPDYRGISASEHASLLGHIFEFLTGSGRVPQEWFAAQVTRLDRSDGDIDALSRRLAFIRTWTYVAQRGWVDDEAHWRSETRAVEDRLSDALHTRLTQRFVDRRTSVLLRRLKDKESLVAEVNDRGEVTVEGEFVGRLQGFRFHMDRTGSPEEARTLRQAAEAALKPQFVLRADRCYNAPDTEFDITEQGGLMWGDAAVGKLTRGADALHPGIEVFVDEEAGADVAEKVKRRLQHFLDRRLSSLFEPLLALQKDEALTGLARGFAFRLVEAFGVLPRNGVAAEAKALDQDARAALRRHGIRFGQYTIFLPALLKPAPTRLRLVLWGLWQGHEVFPESPPPGLVTIPNVEGTPAGSYTMSGYHRAGARAIRIDMLERLADLIRAQDSRAGFEAGPEMLSITGMTLDQFADLMRGLGYSAEMGERARKRPAPRAHEATAEEILAEAERRAAAEAAELAAGVDQAAAATADTTALAGPAEAASAANAMDAGAAATLLPTSPAPQPAEVPAVSAEAAGDVGTATASDAPAEMESFYTFRWQPRPRFGARAGQDGARNGGHPRRRARAAASDGTTQLPPPDHAEVDGSRNGRPPRRERGRSGSAHGGRAPDSAAADAAAAPAGPRFAKGGKNRATAPGSAERGARNYEARPPRKERAVDPDSPFAILAALKGEG